MSLTRIWTIARLELTQRLRSAGWYILLGVFALVLLIVTVLALMAFSFTPAAGSGAYSAIVMLVLLLVVLISPTLSGSSINGDREAATLASLQTTLASTGDIMVGKLLAAIITGAAFLLVAVPFLVVSMLAGVVRVDVLLVSLLILAAEIVIVAAIGVGWSGLVARPLFSVANTYLVVAALCLGTLLFFGLAGSVIRTDVELRDRAWDAQGQPICDRWETRTVLQPRFDYVWGFLAANPFVVLADATPTTYTPYGSPADMFGGIKLSVRSAQLPPQTLNVYDPCLQSPDDGRPTPKEIIESTTPSWFVGLGIQTVIAAGLFAGAWARTRTPARRLPPGTRIA
ncbi:ABC transporter permease [Microbacterium azadirachtae]|uniref:ABC transporter permease n=1 Tax=Microbacterium azadirachtae TaxID=582680 RepID=UPI0021D50542|nr:ABC transporter permease [Microbacterium azadirachtae]UXW85162.1 ABC transporter permease [Microbacterium azadirachtae]